MLAPSALLARRALAAGHPGFPPPLGPLRLRALDALRRGSSRARRSGCPARRATCARRSRGGCARGAPPAFPPEPADALLLGGTVFDLLAREEGERAAVAAARGGADRLIADGFHGRGVRHTEDAWRSHLARLADASASPRRRS